MVPHYKLEGKLVKPKLKKDGSNIEEVDNAQFVYEKVFGEKAFTAAGIIRIGVGKYKPVKPSKDNAFVSDSLMWAGSTQVCEYRYTDMYCQFFFVHKGGLEITVHRSIFKLGPGGMFWVPRGQQSHHIPMCDIS